MSFSFGVVCHHKKARGGEMRNVRIAMFWPTLAGGGVERNGVKVSRELLRRGFDVDIVLANASGPLANEVPSGARVVDLNLRLGGGRLVLAVGPLAKYLSREKPDVLWSNMTEVNVIAIAATLSASHRPWCIVSERNVLTPRVKKSIAKRVVRLAAQWLYPKADRIHAVSLGVADDVAVVTKVDRRRIRVIYNPILTEDMLLKAEQPLNDPWFLPGEPPVILGAGRLVPQKDFATLIRAFALVRSRIRARLVILGEGPLRGELESLAQQLGVDEDVRFIGFVLNPFVYMKRAAVFVLPSLHEGFPNVLAEAMAVGTPVVATNCPSGPDEILEGGKWGHLVPIRDTRALADAIAETLLNPNPSRVEGALRRVEKLRLEHIVDEYLRELFPPRMDTESLTQQ